MRMEEKDKKEEEKQQQLLLSSFRIQPCKTCFPRTISKINLFSTSNLLFFTSDRWVVGGRGRSCRPRNSGRVRDQQWDLLITDLFYSPAVPNCLDTLKWNFSVIFQVTSHGPRARREAEEMKCFRLHATFTNCVGFLTLKRGQWPRPPFSHSKEHWKNKSSSAYLGLPQSWTPSPRGRSRKGKKEGILCSFLFNFSGGISSI